jgi:16S rRNA (cytosine967-C5)-methyltransferase
MAALRALESIEGGSHADRALRYVLDRMQDVRERALTTELVYGVLRWRATLDYELKPRLRKKTDPKLENILRIALYQMRYLERVPPHAILNSAVEQAKKEGMQFASGMVNAILRSIQREGPLPIPDGGRPSALAVRYSHPEWLVKAWLDDYGPKATEALLAADQHPAELVVRVRSGTVKDAIQELAGADVEARPGKFAPGSVHILGGGDPGRWPAIQEGRWVLQDEAAQAMVSLLPTAEKHLDLCAAPGGKAFFLADRDERATIYAVDREASRVADLVAYRDRLGLTDRVPAIVADATAPVLDGVKFASVLVDAPCSGLGTLRRNPDRKWRGEPNASLPGLQAAILRQAAKQTAPGGSLLYVTCTLWRPENEDVALEFEAANPEWERATPLHPFLDSDGFYRSRPDLHGTDGFFAVLWKAPR